MFSAGRVLLMPKGAYNPLTTYEMLDIVSYNGSSYIAKGTTTGNLPTDTTYWQLSAYGGQAANMAGNFAELESSSVATAIHYVDDIFVDENSQLMKATQTINIGDTIDANVNCAPTTVEALIAYLSSYVDSLDSLNKKIQGAIEIAAQTDLHSLAIGEYYKKQTTFYVTNAPTGIDQEASATFRLTVEAALDNASQASSPLLLTLRTPGGVVYTQGFDGSAWGSWVEVASAASVSALNTAKQPKTLDTPITVGGVQQTTVEGALGSINQTLTQQANAMVNVYGSKNILQNNLVSMSQDGVNFVVNEDKSITIDTNGQTVSVEQNGVNLCHFVSEFSGDFKLSHGNATLSSELKLMMEDATTHEWSIAPQTVSMVKGHTYWVWIIYNAGLNIAQASAKTIYPMLRDARIIDGYYEPYAMTNREMTPYVQAISNPNLLDNPWFTVNQRGQSSYSGNVYGYDRWIGAANSSVESDTNGVKIINTLWQRFESDFITKISGKSVTLSVLLGDGTIYSASGIASSANGTFITIDNDVLDARFIKDNYFTFVHIHPKDSSGLVIRAVKLELGSVSTLAQDTAPNYATELLKCQRYFWRKKASVAPYLGLINGEGSCRTTINTPTIMRAVPTMSAITASVDLGQCAIYGMGRSTTPSAISIMNDSPIGNGVVVFASTFSDANLTPNNAVSQRFNVDIDFSADL